MPKKMLPAPFVPTSGGSSPKCGVYDVTIGNRPEKHAAISLLRRLFRQSFGQTVQRSSSRSSASTRCSSTPSRNNARYDGSIVLTGLIIGGILKSCQTRHATMDLKKQ